MQSDKYDIPNVHQFYTFHTKNAQRLLPRCHVEPTENKFILEHAFWWFISFVLTGLSEWPTVTSSLSWK